MGVEDCVENEDEGEGEEEALIEEDGRAKDTVRV